MKKMQSHTNELRVKTIKDLSLLLNKEQDKLVKTRIAISLHKEKNTSLVSSMRKEIARIQTVLKEIRS